MKKIKVESKNQPNQRWNKEQRTRITVQKKNLAPKDEENRSKNEDRLKKRIGRERKRLQTVMGRNNLSREGEGA